MPIKLNGRLKFDYQNFNRKKDMEKLEGFQRKYLRGLAHSLKPVILIGQKGFTEELLRSTIQAFQSHELIKVKFIDFKEKEQKSEISKALERETGSELVGGVGHIYIFFKQHDDPEKRRIHVPQRDNHPVSYRD
jgi:RNA-binding protein